MGCKNGAQEGGHSFSLGLHTTAFQAKTYAIKECVMENTEKGYTCKSIHILSDRQPTRPLTVSR
jgi:hypothetical protein